MGVRNAAGTIIRQDAAMGSVLLDVFVSPNASRTEVRGADPWRHGIQVRVAAKVTKGAANAELLRFFARLLGVPSSSVRIVAGLTSRRKTLSVAGLTTDQVAARVGRGGVG